MFVGILQILSLCSLSLTTVVSFPFAFSFLNKRLFDNPYLPINSFSFSKFDGKKINTLIFEGGGVRALVYSGAIKRLEEENLIRNIRFVSGTSSGAHTAALLSCGFTSTELYEAMQNAPWDCILNGKFFSLKGFYRLMTQFGLSTHVHLQYYLDDLIYQKIGIRNVTFQELYNLTNIHLKIGVCSLKEKDFIYIDHCNYPEMPVSVGLTASSSIPFIFTSVKWNDDIFIDGGLIGNLPITSFPNETCLAFNLINKSNKKNKIKKKSPTNLFSYLKSIIVLLLKNAQKIYSSTNPCITNIDFIEVYTKNIDVLNPNLPSEDITQMLYNGYYAVDNYLNSSFT